MNNRPPNLWIDEEPYYIVNIKHPDGSWEFYGRWKRVTAISRARYVAVHNPNATVFVGLSK